jgi:hypothetical protein
VEGQRRPAALGAFGQKAIQNDRPPSRELRAWMVAQLDLRPRRAS